MSIDKIDRVLALIQFIQREKRNIASQQNAHKGDDTEFFAVINVFDTMLHELENVQAGLWRATAVTQEEGLRHFFTKWRKEEMGVHERGEWEDPDLSPYTKGTNRAILWLLQSYGRYAYEDVDSGSTWDYCHIERDKLSYRTFQFRAEEEGRWLEVQWQSQIFSASRGMLLNRDFNPELLNHPAADKAWKELVTKLLADEWEILDPIRNYVWWRRSFRRKPR